MVVDDGIKLTESKMDCVDLSTIDYPPQITLFELRTVFGANSTLVP